jgi:hypothetical protein
MAKSILKKLEDIFTIHRVGKSYNIQAEHYTNDPLTVSLTKRELLQLKKEIDNIINVDINLSQVEGDTGKGSVTTGLAGIGSKSGTFVAVEQDKTGWKCDDGVTYWR